MGKQPVRDPGLPAPVCRDRERYELPLAATSTYEPDRATRRPTPAPSTSRFRSRRTAGRRRDASDPTKAVGPQRSALSQRVKSRSTQTSRSAILAAVVIFVVAFPAQLFNSTFEANYNEIVGWFGVLHRFRRKPKAVDATAPEEEVSAKMGDRGRARPDGGAGWVPRPALRP